MSGSTAAHSNAHPAPTTPRAFVCRCGRPIFFRNSECLACHTPLGYDAEQRELLPLEAVGDSGFWRRVDAGDDAPQYRRCANLITASGCNWLVAADDAHAGSPAQCRCCRLTRTLPDLSVPQNQVLWHSVAMAQRRLASTLIGLGLPLRAKTTEDPERGLAFDLLRSPEGGPGVITGHDDGVITLDIEEADDSVREERRSRLGEPYRTLLGHLRHECGHYYWQILVDGTGWLEPYRVLFGDEREDYSAALKRHYENGPPPDWGARHVSAYASSHAWEDWAETWAHYMHLVDTLDTARSFGVEGEQVELHYERYGPEVLADTEDPHAASFLELVNGWMELTGVLNELSRSMGVADFYPFVLSAPALRKLHFVHRLVGATARGEPPPATAPASVAAPVAPVSEPAIAAAESATAD